MISMLDLVGLPYAADGTDPRTGVDCLWAARQALQRIFADLADAEFPLDKAAALELAGASDRWESVRHADTLGDVLLGAHPEPWVAVLVDPIARYCFTANRTRGTRLVFIGNLGHVSQVLRRRAAC